MDLNWNAESRHKSRFTNYSADQGTRVTLRGHTSYSADAQRQSSQIQSLKRQREIDPSEKQIKLSRKDFLTLYSELQLDNYDRVYRALEQLFMYFRTSFFNFLVFPYIPC